MCVCAGYDQLLDDGSFYELLEVLQHTAVNQAHALLRATAINYQEHRLSASILMSLLPTCEIRNCSIVTLLRIYLCKRVVYRFV